MTPLDIGPILHAARNLIRQAVRETYTNIHSLALFGRRLWAGRGRVPAIRPAREPTANVLRGNSADTRLAGGSSTCGSGCGREGAALKGRVRASCGDGLQLLVLDHEETGFTDLVAAAFVRELDHLAGDGIDQLLAKAGPGAD
jgi:hypothetical protein